MSSAPENTPNTTGEQAGEAAIPASSETSETRAIDSNNANNADNAEQQLATKLERLEAMDRDIAQLNALTSEISQNVQETATPPSGAGLQTVSQQVSQLEPRLSTIQSSLFEHQVELRSELHAMRAEFGKLQQQQERELGQLEKVRDRLQEKMNSLGLSQTTQLGLTAIVGLALLATLGWIGSSLLNTMRRAPSAADPNSPEAFVYQHLQDIRDGNLDKTWAQAADSFREQAAQGDIEAYKAWWTDVAYPLPETAVTNVTQVKLYTEWSYCNRETNEVLQNVGFWYLSQVPGNGWRLDRIEIPPDLPARNVGKC